MGGCGKETSFWPFGDDAIFIFLQGEVVGAGDSSFSSWGKASFILPSTLSFTVEDFAYFNASASSSLESHSIVECRLC